MSCFVLKSSQRVVLSRWPGGDRGIIWRLVCLFLAYSSVRQAGVNVVIICFLEAKAPLVVSSMVTSVDERSFVSLLVTQSVSLWVRWFYTLVGLVMFVCQSFYLSSERSKLWFDFKCQSCWVGFLVKGSSIDLLIYQRSKLVTLCHIGVFQMSLSFWCHLTCHFEMFIKVVFVLVFMGHNALNLNSLFQVVFCFYVNFEVVFILCEEAKFCEFVNYVYLLK